LRKPAGSVPPLFVFGAEGAVGFGHELGFTSGGS